MIPHRKFRSNMTNIVSSRIFYLLLIDLKEFKIINLMYEKTQT